MELANMTTTTLDARVQALPAHHRSTFFNLLEFLEWKNRLPGQQYMTDNQVSLSEIESDWRGAENRATLAPMLGLIRLILGLVLDLFRSRAALEAEVLVLRQQIIVLRRGQPGRLLFRAADRVVLGWVCRLFPNACDALAIVRPETVVRWHRAGFRSYWRWKSRRRLGRPSVPIEVRRLIRKMSQANPLWGAPRIHGELLKLGIDVGQTSVAKYMVRRRRPPSQGWRTFLRIHADGIAAMDLFVVPTVSFRLLYGLLIVRHSRRQIMWFGVTAHPTAEWLANQLTEAVGWEPAPGYLIRDRDCCYGAIFVRRVHHWASAIIRRRRARLGRMATQSV
jgi:hypothetical protein